MSEKKLSMQSSIAWNSIGSMFYLGCQWLMTVLVVRISGVETAGLLTLAMSATNIWYSLAVYGMRNYQVSDILGKYSDGIYIFSRIFTVGFAFFGCVVYSFVISYDNNQRACILIYCLYKMTEAWYDVYAGIFQKNWRLDYAGKSMLLRGILSIASFVIVLRLTDSLVSAFVCMAVSCAAAVILHDTRTARKLCDAKITVDVKKAMHLLLTCLPLVVYTLLSTSIATIPRLYMERILGGYKLGIYGTVATPTLIIQMAATYIFNPFVTLFAEKYHEKKRKEFQRALWKCAGALGIIAVLGVLAGKFLGYWGLNLLYGAEVAAFVELLIPLIVCTITTAFAWLLCGVLTAIREFKGLVIGNAAAVAVSVLFSGLFEARYDMQGASLVLEIANVVEIVLMLFFLQKNLNRQFNS